MGDGERGARIDLGLAGGEFSGHSEAAHQSLYADHDEDHDREHPDRRPTVVPEDHHQEGDRGDPDQHPVEPVGVFVEDPALHLRERIEQHVVPEGVRPVRHRQPGLHAGDQPAADDQHEDGRRRDEREEARRGDRHGSIRAESSSSDEGAESAEHPGGHEEPGDPEESRDEDGAVITAAEEAADHQEVDGGADQARRDARANRAEEPARGESAEREDEQLRGEHQFAEGEPGLHEGDVAECPHHRGRGESESDDQSSGLRGAVPQRVGRMSHESSFRTEDGRDGRGGPGEDSRPPAPLDPLGNAVKSTTAGNPRARSRGTRRITVPHEPGRHSSLVRDPRTDRRSAGRDATDAHGPHQDEVERAGAPDHRGGLRSRP